MTIGEILRQVASEYDNIEVDSGKWITMEFSVRTESDGKFYWESPLIKYDEEE